MRIKNNSQHNLNLPEPLTNFPWYFYQSWMHQYEEVAGDLPYPWLEPGWDTRAHNQVKTICPWTSDAHAALHWFYVQSWAVM